jgi:hypothetical protein
MSILIGLHNITRWVVLVLAIVALVRAYRGWFGKRDWLDTDRKIGVFFAASMDTQLLLGLILWFFGNWGLKAFDIAASLDGGQRMEVLFFALEHSTTMIVATILVHVGTGMAKRAADSIGKHKRSAILFSVAILLVLVAIPWAQRPIFPGLG